MRQSIRTVSNYARSGLWVSALLVLFPLDPWHVLLDIAWALVVAMFIGGWSRVSPSEPTGAGRRVSRLQKIPSPQARPPRLSLPFCVAPFHPSRSSRRGLALGWLCGAIAWSGMEGPGSVPSPPLSTSVFGQPWLGGQDRTLSLLAARRQLERGSSPVFFDCRGSRVQARAAMFPLPEKLRTVSGFGGRCHRRSLLSQVARRVRARAAALSVVEWWTLCG